MLSVDGTHCPFRRQGAQYYSYKLNRSTVTYEVGLNIKTGDIVWIHGPLPAGEYNDVKMFRMALKHQLDDNERVEADRGYEGERPLKAKTPGLDIDSIYIAMKSDVAARHETVNNRLKMFQCLTQQFRHSFARHASCFRAAAVVLQLSIDYGEPLFQVDYENPTTLTM